MATKMKKIVEIEILGGVEYRTVSWVEVPVKAKPVSEYEFRRQLDSKLARR
jgi:hypothetical protein